MHLHRLIVTPTTQLQQNLHPSMVPTELYRYIVGSLDNNGDRVTLLSVAQCCKALREEGQRVLFRSTSGEILSDTDEISRHKSFLQAVIGSPQRLALYVKEFIQNGIGWEPGYKSAMAQHHPDYEARAEVYALTMQALPLMVNLERLTYFPFFAYPSAQGLGQCSSRLKILDIGGLEYDDELLSFLSNQESLRHISADWITGSKLSSARKVLPRLVSVRGAPSTFLALSEASVPGQIRAFDCLHANWLPKYTNKIIRAVSGLKYLRTNNPATLRNISQGNSLPESVMVLEVTCRVTTTMELEFLPYLPLSLHVLVLRHNEYDGHKLSQDEMERTADTAFTRCPSLAYVDFCPLDLVQGWRCRRPTSTVVEPCFNTLVISDHPMNWWKRHLLD